MGTFWTDVFWPFVLTIAAIGIFGLIGESLKKDRNKREEEERLRGERNAILFKEIEAKEKAEKELLKRAEEKLDKGERLTAEETKIVLKNSGVNKYRNKYQ